MYDVIVNFEIGNPQFIRSSIDLKFKNLLRYFQKHFDYRDMMSLTT